MKFYPTPNLIPKFLDMLTHTNLTERTVYALPLYEIKADQKIPETKTELQNMIRNNTAFIFHSRQCLPCYKIPESEKWEMQRETDRLNVFKSVKRTGLFKYWEPIYIGTKQDPLFDERLYLEGRNTKSIQVKKILN